MNTRLIEALAVLFGELERIASEHEEMTDTDVREALHLTLNYYFVWGKPRSRFPRSFGMFSAEGDRRIGKAIRKFLDMVDELDEVAAIPVGQARLDFLQQPDVRTASGMQYDEFIGYRETPLDPDPLPEFMFLEGEYDGEPE